MGVGIQLKMILRNKKMTIKQLSERTAVPLNTLYSITKRDSERVDPVILQAIAAALGVPTSALYGEAPVPDDLPPIPPQPRPMRVCADKPTGIYAIRCNATGRLYVGISTNIDGRLRNHLANLRAGKHPAAELQADFDKHGEGSLSLFVLEEGLTADEARRKEQEYITEYDTRNLAHGYNIVHPGVREQLCLIHAKPPKPDILEP